MLHMLSLVDVCFACGWRSEAVLSVACWHVLRWLVWLGLDLHVQPVLEMHYEDEVPVNEQMVLVDGELGAVVEVQQLQDGLQARTRTYRSGRHRPPLGRSACPSAPSDPRDCGPADVWWDIHWIDVQSSHTSSMVSRIAAPRAWGT